MKTQMDSTRPERTDDLLAIRAVHVACFPTDAEARLVDALRTAGQLSISIVADIDGRIVGHAGFSPVVAANGTVGMGLAPVAVIVEYRKQGIAAQIIQAGLEACRTAGHTWSVVLGNPKYYKRFGYQPASTYQLSDEYAGGGAFQALALIPDGIPIGSGLVRYRQEFNDCGC